MRFLAITGALSMVPASVAGPLHVQRDLSPSQHLSEKWTYSGCYVDNISNRTLKGGYQSVDNQSGRHCTDYCDSLGYDIAGTEYSRECFCGQKLNYATEANEADCAMPCTGQYNEACGGPERLSVYQVSVGTRTNQGDGTTFTYSDCYADSVQNRLLPTESFAGSTMTVAGCVSACRNAGFVSNSTSTAYAGVEYGRECYCGRDTVLPAPVAGTKPSMTGCDLTCSGNGTEYCGGSSRINIYVVKSPDTATTSSSSTTEPATTTTLLASSSSSDPVTSQSPPSSSVDPESSAPPTTLSTVSSFTTTSADVAFSPASTDSASTTSTSSFDSSSEIPVEVSTSTITETSTVTSSSSIDA